MNCCFGNPLHPVKIESNRMYVWPLPLLPWENDFQDHWGVQYTGAFAFSFPYSQSSYPYTSWKSRWITLLVSYTVLLIRMALWAFNSSTVKKEFLHFKKIGLEKNISSFWYAFGKGFTFKKKQLPQQF